MKFYVCSTPYHLYVSLCMILSEGIESSIYLSTPDEDVFELFKKYKERMSNIDSIKNVYLRKRDNKKERVYIESIKDIFQYKNIKNEVENSQVYIFPWHPYSLYTPSEYIFKKAKNIKLVEDGSNVYLKKPENKLSKLIKKYIYLRNTEFYKSPKITDIYVQYPSKYPDHLKNKLSLLDLNKIQSDMKKIHKEKIISVFNSNIDINKMNNINTIILTQPLSEDGFMSENKKISLYSDIIENEKQNIDILIKKHPRDKTQYKFKDIIELEGDFPSEIFNLLDIEFEKAIGICTSAVNSIKAKEAYNTDEKFFEKN